MTMKKFLYRRNASQTSVEAAENLDVTRLEEIIYRAIVDAKEHGMTQDELLTKFDSLPYSSVTARPAALKRKKLVVDSGLRRKGRTGRNQVVLIAKRYEKEVS
jgi:hypothetical protein